MKRIFPVSLKSLIAFLTSPLTILAAMIIGTLFGIFSPQFSKKLSFGGGIYLKYVELLTVPLIICATGSSLAIMLQKKNSGKDDFSLGKLIRNLCLIMLVSSALGILTEFALHKCFPTQINIEQLDELIHQKESQGDNRSIRLFEKPKEVSASNVSFRNFIMQLLPVNIFKSLSQGNTMQILFFTILFGIALGMLKPKTTKALILVLQSIYQACLFLIGCSIYVQPVCVFCLMASNLAVLDSHMLVILVKLISFIVIAEILFIISALCVWSKTAHISLKKLLKYEGKALLLGFSSRSRLLTMPMIMNDLEEKMKFSREQVNLAVPFVFTISNFSDVFMMSCIAVFIGYLYDGFVSWSIIIMVFFCSPVVAVGGFWPINIVTLLILLGYPTELGLILMVAIGSIVDPFGTVINVVWSSAVSSWSFSSNKQAMEQEKSRNMVPKSS